MRYFLFSRKLLFIIAFILIIGGVFLAWTRIEQATRTRLTIDVNGHTQRIYTDAPTVGSALSDAGILIDPADIVSPPLDYEIEDNMTIVVQKAHQLVLEIDGQVQRIYTHRVSPIVILSEKGIQLAPEDRLFVNHKPYNPEITYTEPPAHLRIIPAVEYTIYDTSQVYNGVTTARRVGDVLHENGISLYLADRILPVPEAPLRDGIEIYITRSDPVHIRVDGQELHTRAAGETVMDVLTMLGLPLTGKDYSIPAETHAFEPDMLIEVVRVIETVEIYEEEIAYQTVKLQDTSLPTGEEQIIQAGIPGIRAYRIRIRKENGLEVTRLIQESWVIIEPVSQIIAYGSLPESEQINE